MTQSRALSPQSSFLFSPTLLACAALLGAAAFGVPNAEARGSLSVLRQITNLTTGTIEDARIRSEKGDTMTFTSTGDVMGAGSETGHREIYYYDFQTDVMQQVTISPTGESYSPARSTDQVFAGARPHFVAFISTADLDLTRDNSDGNPEVFFWTVETGEIHQITDSVAPVLNHDVFPSDSGKCIVWSSTDDLDDNDNTDNQNPPTGFSNPDGSEEVFMYSLTAADAYPYGGMTTQVSNGPVGTTSRRPVIGGYWFPRQCQSTMYQSDHDQLTDGSSGNQLYVFTRKNADTNRMDAPKEVPLGVPDGDFGRPMITAASNFARGPFGVFSTDANVWRNESTGLDLYRYRIFHPRMTQYTDYDDGIVLNPEISDGGGLVVFQSDADPIKRVRHSNIHQPPFNGDHNMEIYTMKGRRKTRQITRTENCTSTNPTLRDDGTAMVFLSSCDLITNGVTSTNAAGQMQIFEYRLVKNDDPLFSTDGCVVAEGCCNILNGCLTIDDEYPVEGRAPRVTKKNCEVSSKGCR